MKRIKELRESRHISQQRLAAELNVSQAMISKYELGQAEPDVRTIRSICRFFNVSSDYLLEISDSRFNITESGLSETEKKVLFDFKRLDGLRKEKLSAYLQGLLQE